MCVFDDVDMLFGRLRSVSLDAAKIGGDSGGGVDEAIVCYLYS